MDPILEEIYSTVLQGAPFVIGAYASIWLILLVFVVVTMLGLKKTEKQMAVLEEAIAEK